MSKQLELYEEDLFEVERETDVGSSIESSFTAGRTAPAAQDEVDEETGHLDMDSKPALLSSSQHSARPVSIRMVGNPRILWV
jgi:hypothetical protein